MKKILLPTDFSKNSINAINYAMELFRNETCDFYILNVQKASSFISDDMMVVNSSATIYNTIVDAAKKSISNIIAKIAKKYNNEKHYFESIVDYDNFIDSINQVSEKQQIDLIIMGTKGASGLAKVLFGSNTIKVIQRGNVPVLAIPDDCTFTNIDKIAFTTSFEYLYKIEDLRQLKQMLLLNKSQLYILHAINDDDFAEEISKDIDFFRLNFKDPKFEYLHVDEKKSVCETILEYSKRHDVKMIAMAINKHTFFQRLFNRHTFEDIACTSDIPFLVMKNSEE
ncbi:universal stress protein [Mariniflexile sp.]|uniref:universal stress protein n=1 Tax=Mariniflexile sp. TaxID=1979402 RepID=UPI0040486E91